MILLSDLESDRIWTTNWLLDFESDSPVWLGTPYHLSLQPIIGNVDLFFCYKVFVMKLFASHSFIIPLSVGCISLSSSLPDVFKICDINYVTLKEQEKQEKSLFLCERVGHFLDFFCYYFFLFVVALHASSVLSILLPINVIHKRLKKLKKISLK